MPNISNYNLRDFYNILKTRPVLYQYQFVASVNGDASLMDCFDKLEGGAEDMTYFIQSADIPGVDISVFKAPFLGTEFRTPGVKQFKHNWTASILVTQDFAIYDCFKAWMYKISDLSRDGGGDKKVPDANITLGLLDPSNQEVVKTITLAGVWPKSVGDISLQYAQGGGNPINNFPIEFRYQYSYLDGADPLEA